LAGKPKLNPARVTFLACRSSLKGVGGEWDGGAAGRRPAGAVARRRVGCIRRKEDNSYGTPSEHLRVSFGYLTDRFQGAAGVPRGCQPSDKLTSKERSGVGALLGRQ